jgi:hypothetical protein
MAGLDFSSTTSSDDITYVLIPVSTSTEYPGSFVGLYTSTITSAGRTIESTSYGPQTTVLYSTSISTIGVPEAVSSVSTVTSELIITNYLPTLTYATLETVHGTETPIISTLYGPIGGISTVLTTYITTLALARPSSSLSGPTQTAAAAVLSTGAKAGIGIGVILALIIFAAIAVGWFVLQKRRRARPQLPETMSSSQGGFEKPELDATEVSKAPDEYTPPRRRRMSGLDIINPPTYSKTERGEVELDTAERPKADGRAELEGRMMPRPDVIRRKEVGNVKAPSMVDDKEVLHEV